MKKKPKKPARELTTREAVRRLFPKAVREQASVVAKGKVKAHDEEE